MTKEHKAKVFKLKNESYCYRIQTDDVDEVIDVLDWSFKRVEAQKKERKEKALNQEKEFLD